MNVVDQTLLKVMSQCRTAGVRLVISAQPTIKQFGVDCAGWFGPIDDGPEHVLAVATGVATQEWLPTLLHEYCHMQQWLEDPKHFKQLDDHETLVFKWVAGEVELNNVDLAAAIWGSVWLEGDCERRAQKLIKAWGLEGYINPDEYGQKGMAYAHFYNAVKQFRKWYRTGQAPYSVESVWREFPSTVDVNWTPTEKHMKLYESCL